MVGTFCAVAAICVTFLHVGVESRSFELGPPVHVSVGEKDLRVLEMAVFDTEGVVFAFRVVRGRAVGLGAQGVVLGRVELCLARAPPD